jgi:kumamolisin
MSKTHTVLEGSQRPQPAGAVRVRDIDPNAHVEVTIVLKAPELPPPDEVPAKALSPAELRQKYGADPKTIRKVEDKLGSYGLHSEGVGTTGRSLRVSGTAADMELAFHAGMGIYHSAAQGDFRAREGSVSVPSQIADLVEAVLGLDQRRAVKRHAPKPAATVGTQPLPAFRPADIEQHYNFPPGDCAGQKIAIAEFGQVAYFPDDVAYFCMTQGRPVPVVNLVPVNTLPLTAVQYSALPEQLKGDVSYPDVEVMMDVEIVAALCPAAEISVYFASWGQDGFYELIDRVINDRPVTLSISWGTPEDVFDEQGLWTPDGVQKVNEKLNEARIAGITVCVSSGDDACSDGQYDGRAHVDFPASSPHVLSVGGTMFTRQGEGGVPWWQAEEVVWWEPPGFRDAGGGSTGGGVSTQFDRPAWQTFDIPSINPGSIKGRIVPDVAALAGPPFYLVWVSSLGPGLTPQGGGTSAAAPVWAALVARINAALPAAKQQQFITPLLYQNNVGAQGFTDIVSGNNFCYVYGGNGYSAGAGFDAVTGWGVPNGQELLSLLAK